MYLLIKNSFPWVWDESDYRNGNADQLTDILIDKTSGCIVSIGDSYANVSIEETIDARGQLLLPGFHDAHIHIASTGESQFFLDLGSCNSIREFQDAIKSHCAQHPQLDWIIGVNWDQTNLGRYVLDLLMLT